MSETRGFAHQGDVLEDDVELSCALEQVLADPGRDDLALGDQLCGVELGDGGLEDFVADRGEDSLVVGGAEGAIDGGEVAGVGAEHDAEGERDGLEVLGAGRGRDVLCGGGGQFQLTGDTRRERTTDPGLDASLHEDGSLEPRDEEVGSLDDGL